LVGNPDFNAPQFIVQNDISRISYPYQDYTYGIGQHENNILQNRQDKLKKSKKSKKGPYLVNVDFREVVEMSYWLIKFVGQFERQYKEHVNGKSEANFKYDTDNKSTGEGLFSKNAATMISYSRFLLKFLGSFEKLFKKL
jgi:hypothetical protein